MHSNVFTANKSSHFSKLPYDASATYLGSYKQSFLNTWATVFGPNQVPTGFLEQQLKVESHLVSNLSTLSPMRAIWWMEY